MTRSEARTETSRQLSNARETLKFSKSQTAKTTAANKIDYLVAVQKALCEPTEEQVEQTRGCAICLKKTCLSCRQQDRVPEQCVGCRDGSRWVPWNFCPVCGKPLTKEGVDILLMRWEEAQP